MTILVILYVQLVHFLYKVIVIDANPADVGLSDVEWKKRTGRESGWQETELIADNHLVAG